MEDDKDLRKLLSEGALVKASADFSNNVMAGISQVQPAPVFQIEKWKRLFKTMAAIFIMVAMMLSFFINPNALPYSFIEKLSRIPTNYIIIVSEYLIAFWVLIAISFWMNKSSEDELVSHHKSYTN